MRLGRRKLILAAIVMVASSVFVLNKNVSIVQGVDHHYRVIKMPLYVKWIQFLSRHYEYARLTKEIVNASIADEEKVIKIFNWTHANIRKVPDGMPVVDDHVLNIIIRGYGTSDQSEDVFTTLCDYAGISAFWDILFDKEHKIRYPISYVKISGRWCVFDAYHDRYFKNKKGEIASIEDLINDKSIIGNAPIGDIKYNGIPYREFYYDLKSVNVNRTLRPAKQKPLGRIIFEMKKVLGIEKETEDEKNIRHRT